MSAAVPLHQSTTVWRDPDAPIPDFEGKQVEFAALMVRGLNAIDVDRVMGMDDIVHLEIEARVVFVDHRVREKDGKLGRIQTIKVISATVTPFNAGDPHDTGIMAP